MWTGYNENTSGDRIIDGYALLLWWSPPETVHLTYLSSFGYVIRQVGQRSLSKKKKKVG